MEKDQAKPRVFYVHIVMNGNKFILYFFVKLKLMFWYLQANPKNKLLKKNVFKDRHGSSFQPQTNPFEYFSKQKWATFAALYKSIATYMVLLNIINLS